MMILFADCTTHLLTILDDVEMYEKQKSFALGHFVTLSSVVNQFLFKAIWSNLILESASPLFVSLHSLLQVLYRRDNRRPFTKPNHWLIKDIKAKELISEMDKGRRAAALLIQKMPHIIPHADRYLYISALCLHVQLDIYSFQLFVYFCQPFFSIFSCLFTFCQLCVYFCQLFVYICQLFIYFCQLFVYMR